MRKLENGKEQIYYVGDDVHTLCIGATRSGKSRTIVVQSICTLGLAGESLVVSDPKAELYQYTNDFLQKLGYDVKVLDFKNPEKSHRYNLLQPVIDAVNRGDFEKAEMSAWDMTNTLVGKSDGEKIWTKRKNPPFPCVCEPKCVISVLNDQGGESFTIEKKEISPTLRSEAFPMRKSSFETPRNCSLRTAAVSPTISAKPPFTR